MRAFVVAVALVLWAVPAAAEDAGQAPCAMTLKRDISDEKARRRCGLPDGQVSRSYKQDRVIIFVT